MNTSERARHHSESLARPAALLYQIVAHARRSTHSESCCHERKYLVYRRYAPRAMPSTPPLEEPQHRGVNMKWCLVDVDNRKGDHYTYNNVCVCV